MIVALYFGSFNPIHIGHISICKFIIDNNKADELRLIVSPRNPLKDESFSLNSGERLDNVKSAILKCGLESRVVVSDIEYSMSPPYYTIKTLRKFKELEPNNRFVLVIGADNLQIIEKWYLWRDLLLEFEIWVYPRSGVDIESLCIKYGCKKLNAPLIEISSTKIREAEKMGLDMSRFRV